MMMYRDAAAGINQSPRFEVFGRKGSNQIIVPLHLALYRLGDEGQPVFDPAITNGIFLGAKVRSGAGVHKGDIADYSWPVVPGMDVQPIIRVTPRPGLNMSQFPVASGSKPPVGLNHKVTLNLSTGIAVEGEITALQASHAFPIPGASTMSWIVRFSKRLHLDDVGGRVVTEEGALLGMLTSIKNSVGPAPFYCDSLVYPVELI